MKVFIDADSINTKISVNVINQKLANSDYKHLLLVYSECPDKEFNIGQLMAFLNKELNVFTYTKFVCGFVETRSKFGKYWVCLYHQAYTLALFVGSTRLTARYLYPGEVRNLKSSHSYLNQFPRTFAITQCTL